MKFMRAIVALSVVVLWCFSIEASDRKSKRTCQGECAVAVAKAQIHTTQCHLDAAAEKKEPITKPGPAQPAETVTPSSQVITSSGSCSSGSCGVPTRYSRRGR